MSFCVLIKQKALLSSNLFDTSWTLSLFFLTGAHSSCFLVFFPAKWKMIGSRNLRLIEKRSSVVAQRNGCAGYSKTMVHKMCYKKTHSHCVAGVGGLPQEAFVLLSSSSLWQDTRKCWHAFANEATKDGAAFPPHYDWNTIPGRCRAETQTFSKTSVIIHQTWFGPTVLNHHRCHLQTFNCSPKLTAVQQFVLWRVVNVSSARVAPCVSVLLWVCVWGRCAR